MKMMATAVVILPRKVPGPLLPKMVWLEPPKTAPILAPFPACKQHDEDQDDTDGHMYNGDENLHFLYPLQWIQ